MTRKKEDKILPQFFYGDGVTPDPMARDRGPHAKKLSQLEQDVSALSQARDGLDQGSY